MVGSIAPGHFLSDIKQQHYGVYYMIRVIRTAFDLVKAESFSYDNRQGGPVLFLV